MNDQMELIDVEQEDDDEDESETEDEDYTEEDEDETEDEDEPAEQHDATLLRSSRVSQNNASTSAQAFISVREDNAVEEREDKRRRTEEEVSSSNRDDSKEGYSGVEWNRTEIDGLFCPICMEAWTSDGDHQVCCLPCGHIYGMSCIKRWFQERRGYAKCPQCNKNFKLKDVRKLYASRIVVVDEESQKKIQSLEAKCVSLETTGANWCKKEAEWHRREAELRLEIHQLTERTTNLERLLEDMQSRPSESVSVRGGCQGPSISGYNFGSNFFRQGSCSFVLQKELRVDGAQLFDIDASSQIILIARRLARIVGAHVLTKMSLIPPYDSETIALPPNTKAVKDLRFSTDCRLALLASLGKKLSVLSMESNHTILSYDLPVPAWSCSWDPNCSYYMYAGLQNGMVLVFDMRQTAMPMQSMNGLTSNPVHTIHSLSHNSSLSSGCRTLLTASSVGLSHWNIGTVQERPFLVPTTENRGVCISLACSPISNDIVASFRPRIEMSGEISFTQSSLTQSSTIGQGVQGSHVLLNRLEGNSYVNLGSTFGNVSDIRLPKSTIIDMENGNRLFASEDEVTRELVLYELPSLSVVERFPSQPHSIRDVKYASGGLLGCLSEDRLRLFR